MHHILHFCVWKYLQTFLSRAKWSRTEDRLKNIWKFLSGNNCIKFIKNICIIFFAEMKERSPRSERGRGTEDGLPDYSELCVVRHLPVISNIKYWILKILNHHHIHHSYGHYHHHHTHHCCGHYHQWWQITICSCDLVKEQDHLLIVIITMMICSLSP